MDRWGGGGDEPRGGGAKNRRKDRKEGKRQETGRRAEAGWRADPREPRNQRSILSDLGSYPRGPAIGLARGGGGLGWGGGVRLGWGGSIYIWIASLWTKGNVC